MYNFKNQIIDIIKENINFFTFEIYNKNSILLCDAPRS